MACVQGMSTQISKEFAMNLSYTFLYATLILAAPLCAAAAHPQLPAVEAEHSGAVVVICKDERLPSQRVVADLLGNNNTAYVYAQREHLAQIAQRECRRGVPYVAFVRDVAANSSTLAEATARAPNGFRVLGMVQP